MIELMWVALWWLLLKGKHQMTGSNVSSAEKTLLLDTLEKLGWPRKEVDALIQFESGWNSRAMNPTSKAAGLIQFMPSTLKRLGFKADLPPEARAAAMRDLVPSEQLSWVVKYFTSSGTKWKYPGDAYLVVAAPAYVGAPDAQTIYPIGSKAWVQNPAWRDGPTGPITAGSIRRIILKRL